MSKVGKMGIVGIVGIVGKVGKVCTRQPRRFRATASYGHPVASAGQPAEGTEIWPPPGGFGPPYFSRKIFPGRF